MNFCAAAFAAIVVSGSVWLASTHTWGGGGNHNGGGNSSGPDSTLLISTKPANAALALQSDARKSETTITQSGYGNGADVKMWRG